MKSSLKSKTLWFNALTVVIVVSTFFGFVPNQDLAEQTSAFLLAASPIINIFLRFLTNKGLTPK